VIFSSFNPPEGGGKVGNLLLEPCLFFPSRESWRSDVKLADIIIPWLSTWLEFYEMWRATGEWYGGGISHGPGREIEAAASIEPGV
jgi:hypothetical protein